MNMAYTRLDTLTYALWVVCSAGCIISPEDDDTNQSGETGGTGSSMTTPPTTTDSDPSVDPSEGTTSSDTAETSDSGMVPDGCTEENLFMDAGFEDGTPSMHWTEASDVFGTPICDAGCTEQAGAVPYAGDWWVWYGGVEQADTSSVSQTVTIEGAEAYLQFRFWINTGSGSGDDVFHVDVDGDTVFMATDLDEGEYDSYTLVAVDLDALGETDGSMHEITFGAELTGNGLTNFFLDNVSVVSCSEGMTDSSSSTTMDPTDTDTDTDATSSTTMSSESTMEGSAGTADGTAEGTAGTAT